MTDTSEGILFLVVGPSGSGKDTLIDGARKMFANDPRITFPHRIITRPADSGGEVHLSVSTDDFAAMEDNGAFALTWRAHGFCYGIPGDITRTLDRGESVVVNVSRGVIEEARGKFPHVHVLSVEVSPDALRDRLIARGRESEEEIAERIARAGAYDPPAEPVTTITTHRRARRRSTVSAP